MARSTEDDSLEPILPRHPPVAPEAAPPDPPVGREATFGGRGGAGRASWERWVLLGCAVLSTLALVVCALRLNAIAADQRIEACQVEVYIGEQLNARRSGLEPTDDRLRNRLGDCIGVDTDTGADATDD
jgi:hypothetical protein